MNIKNSFRRKARIAYDVIDYNLLINKDEAQLRMAQGEELPIHYVVEVQVKVWFFYLTIWRQETDFNDADSREIINKRADDILKALEV